MNDFVFSVKVWPQAAFQVSMSYNKPFFRCQSWFYYSNFEVRSPEYASGCSFLSWSTSVLRGDMSMVGRVGQIDHSVRIIAIRNPSSALKASTPNRSVAIALSRDDGAGPAALLFRTGHGQNSLIPVCSSLFLVGKVGMETSILLGLCVCFPCTRSMFTTFWVQH